MPARRRECRAVRPHGTSEGGTSSVTFAAPAILRLPWAESPQHSHAGPVRRPCERRTPPPETGLGEYF
jgi:hypothetical protein